MYRYYVFVKKELTLLARDLHGLALLFLMPVVFILIMTFALQNQYASSTESNIEYILVNHDQKEASLQFESALADVENLNRLHFHDSHESARRMVSRDEAMFLITINPDMKERLATNNPVVSIDVAPSTTPVITHLVSSQIQQLINRLYLERSLKEEFGPLPILEDINTDKFVETRSLFSSENIPPSSVQQNVPAWLLFAMFFIAVPLSTTLIHERQQGTLDRLKTMGVSGKLIVVGKITPYLFISLLQVVSMLLVGVYLVPALGGDRLLLGESYAGLAVIATAASFAATAYALLIAQVARTVEQATIFSGLCNIIMAALGGIMVPRFIMPETMQNLSALSPMAWALDGFFDIMLRSGSVSDVLPEASRLAALAIILIILALVANNRKEA